MTPDELQAYRARVEEQQATFDSAAVAAAVSARATTQKAAQWHSALERGVAAPNPAARVHWLRREADERTGSVRDIAACSSCSSAHCCYQAVTISEQEAQVIANEIGAKLGRPSRDRVVNLSTLSSALDAQRDRYTGQPCTFLRGSACSIYGSRPVVCRLLVNLERDDLACRIVGTESFAVPYLDTRPEQLAYIGAFGVKRLADVREWFPRGRG